MDINNLISIARAIKKAHAEHHAVEVQINHADEDEHGILLEVDFAAVLPPRALLAAQLESFWWGKLSSADPALFRNGSGEFISFGPIARQRGRIYIPFGVPKRWGSGLYNLSLSVMLPGDGGTMTELATASSKLGLPNPPEWRRMDFLLPFIGICMAVVRADHDIAREEVRGVRQLIHANFALQPEDTEPLRAAMKCETFAPLKDLLAVAQRRLPIFSPQDIFGLMCQVARLDGPINPRERAVLKETAETLSISSQDWYAHAET